MLTIILGLLIALGNGATGVRISTAPDVRIIVEYTATACPTFIDEPCYVYIDANGLLQTGP